MDATHFHLALTHFPIVGTLIGAGILGFGLFFKNDALKKSALILFILMGIITIPVFLTGEGAEETVENFAGISENIIETHENLAKITIWFMGALGIISMISLFAMVKKLSMSRILVLLTFIVSLATMGLFLKVGNTGGQIRHAEIRSNTTVQQGEGNNGAKESRDMDDDD
ncbi:MAG: hypothetical protein KDC85_12665 [Saprospiraceae bacterium]|nr:hypothetical protein [Saprospiraceae bacterium]MCB9325829.1 hypothetical protein [Lewinellaceae bacterium]